MPRLSPQKRKDIESLLLAGKSAREIRDMGKGTVGTILRIRNGIIGAIPAPRMGRPRVFSPEQARSCVRAYTRGGQTTITGVRRMVQNITGVRASRFTVARVLCRAGIRPVAKKKKKPKLTPAHIRARLEWARKHRDWTEDDWRRVIWSDETKINRLGSDGQVTALIRDGEPVSERHVLQTERHGGGSVMVWGCMTWHGVGFMCRIEGNMDRALYQRILEDELARTIEYYGMNPAETIFQQDNDSKHRSRDVLEYLSRQPFRTILDWPSKSPDLNPIEHLWKWLKMRLGAHPEPPRGVHELWARVEDEWNEFSATECQRLIRSMPSRIQAVIRARGRWTKY